MPPSTSTLCAPVWSVLLSLEGPHGRPLGKIFHAADSMIVAIRVGHETFQGITAWSYPRRPVTDRRLAEVASENTQHLWHKSTARIASVCDLGPGFAALRPGQGRRPQTSLWIPHENRLDMVRTAYP